MMRILKKIQIMTIEEAENYLKTFNNKNIEMLYCECVEFKKTYDVAHSRLLNELNKRKDQQIVKDFVKNIFH